jgi:ubiquinone/menaquinone biosynthesis C-methylase UbiE
MFMVSLEKEVKKTYDRIASRYDEKRKSEKLIYNEYNEMPATLSLLRKIKGKKILDLGCGTGIYAKILRRRGAVVSGIDISPKMIELAKQNLKGVRGADFKVGTVYKLPYKSGTFDIVLASLVVHYFTNMDKAFREIKRVLKKNGVFIFSTDNPVINIAHRIKGKPRRYRFFVDYFKEGKFYEYWPRIGVRMPYQHITFQTWIRTIVRNGFVIEDFVDSKTVKKAAKLDRSVYNFTSKVPWFSVFKVRKI